MARPKNEELKHAIQDAARKQFGEQGYDATSYSSIAQACGISRNLVQYHFPKKQQLAIDFMEGLLGQSMEALGYTPDGLHNDFVAIYSVGACYFVYLLSQDGYRRFLYDIIRSRDLTEEILAFNMSWAMQHVDTPALVDVGTDTWESVIVHMGGFYELLYHCLREDKPFDPVRKLRPVMEAFATSLGYWGAEMEQLLPASCVDSREVTAAAAKIDKG